MAIVGLPCLCTAHRDYLRELSGGERAALEPAEQAWAIADAVEEAREHGQQIAVYFVLTAKSVARRAELVMLVRELGYDAELIERAGDAGWFLRVGPERRRPRRSYGRPRRLERHG
jgi:hypothetical protein